jgi:cation diffusion facilitator CzcD-associated flavoprotein CzcO
VGYLEALGKENVEVVYGEITHITERGCVCDNGNEYPVDILICATGFDTSFKPRFPIVAPNGKNLQDVWKEEAQSYLGVAAAEFPNYLIFLGPNCPIGNGPVLSAIGKSFSSQSSHFPTMHAY